MLIKNPIVKVKTLYKDLLDLPDRSVKPRSSGITHILDKGLGLGAVEDYLDMASSYIDIVKLGWGTSYITQNIEDKLALYAKYDIPVCFGGTLLEAFIAQDKIDKYSSWLKELGVEHLELSDGSITLEHSEKLALIEKLSKNFKVLSEVGSKDASVVVAPYKWVKYIKDELNAGAWKVIAEGRESGTVGIFRDSGEIRTGLIEEIVNEIDPHNLIFEAPQKSQQVWFIKQFGANVNLGNIAPDEAIPLETLRLGLRGDTLAHFNGKIDI